MEADISTWQKTGHFYFALTRTVVIIEAPTAARIETLESASPIGLLTIPFATAMDAGVRNTCSQLPGLTFYF
jgi:hypothetical protein